MNFNFLTVDNKKIWPYILLLLSFLLYFPFLGKGFVSDDFIHIGHITNVNNMGNLFLGPGPFDFFRPIYETSFYLNYLISGLEPHWFGFTNLVFHLLVVFLLYKFVRLLFNDRRIAFFSGLIFALAPKSNAMAINWVSGRSDLLMSIFALSALISWLKWMQSGRKHLLAGTFLFYVLSLLCKESALLLPILLFFTLPHPGSPNKKRRYAAFFIFLGTIPVILFRIQAGALMPNSIDAHYNLMVPIQVVAGNLFNYFFRSIPHVVLFLLFLLFPLLLKFRGREKTSGGIFASKDSLGTAVFSLLWFLVFLLPASPIKMRSELYLYLPAAGFCILGAFLLIKAMDSPGIKTADKKKRTAFLVMGSLFFVLLLGSYIVVRNVKSTRVSDFSRQFVSALPDSIPIDKTDRFLYLVPGDSDTEKILRRSVHGYFDTVAKLAYGRKDIGGWILFESDPLDTPPPYDPLKRIKVSVSFQNDRLSLSVLKKPPVSHPGSKPPDTRKRGRLKKRKERLKSQENAPSTG